MTTLRILVVEDESIIAEDICAMLHDSEYQIAGWATNADEAIELFKKESPDLVLMDVQLDGILDGIQTVKLLNVVKKVPIIYLTAQADIETVTRAKETMPSAYLLKPFNHRNLQISIELALNNFVQNNSSDIDSKEAQAQVKLNADSILQKGDTIFIKQNYRFVKINTEDLLYIEADRNHAYIFTKKQKFILRMTLAQIVERIQYEHLLRVHRSYAINMRYVDEFDDTEIILSGKSIPFSSSYKDDFINKFSIV